MKTNRFTKLTDSIVDGFMRFLDSRWYWPVITLWLTLVGLMIFVWAYK